MDRVLCTSLGSLPDTMPESAETQWQSQEEEQDPSLAYHGQINPRVIERVDPHGRCHVIDTVQSESASLPLPRGSVRSHFNPCVSTSCHRVGVQQMLVVYNPLWEQMTFVNHELCDCSFKLTFPIARRCHLEFQAMSWISLRTCQSMLRSQISMPLAGTLSPKKSSSFLLSLINK